LGKFYKKRHKYEHKTILRIFISNVGTNIKNIEIRLKKQLLVVIKLIWEWILKI